MFTAPKTIATVADASPPARTDDVKPEMQNTDTARLLGLDQLEISAHVQPRETLHEATVVNYAELMADGTAFPPVVAFWDGRVYWLADGFHRFEAARRCGQREIAVEVREGSRAAAEFFACGANTKHGLPLNNRDKRRVTKRRLCIRHRARMANAAGKDVSDREIAKHIGVSNTFVGNLQRELFPQTDMAPERGDPDKGTGGDEQATAAGTLAPEIALASGVNGLHLSISSEKEPRPEEESDIASEEPSEAVNGLPLEAAPTFEARVAARQAVRSKTNQNTEIAEGLVACVMGYFREYREASVPLLTAALRQAVPVVEEALKTLHTHESSK
jgi:hypothetical protein